MLRTRKENPFKFGQSGNGIYSNPIPLSQTKDEEAEETTEKLNGLAKITQTRSRLQVSGGPALIKL